MNVKRGKRAQVTLFIVAVVVIIAIILLFFLFRTGVIPEIGGSSKETNEETFLRQCIEDKLEESIEILSLHGGDINREVEKPYITFKFTDEDVFRDLSYLCYNKNYYYSCINQEPMLLEHLENQTKDHIEEDFWNCFDDLVLSLDNEGYVVDSIPKEDSFRVEITPKRIAIKTNSTITLTKNEETARKENFEILFSSRLYEIVKVVQEIVNKEAINCEFNYFGYMLFYPQFKIDKLDTQLNSAIIYTVTHRKTNEMFRFVTRGCVIPPGLG